VRWVRPARQSSTCWSLRPTGMAPARRRYGGTGSARDGEGRRAAARETGRESAVDGTVIEGSSRVDESMLTGEPVPSARMRVQGLPAQP
jgi:hypothetical protein